MRDSKKARNLHREALQDFDKIQEALEHERKECLADRRFYSIPGAQWEGAVGDQFENKPMFEINKIHLAIMKIINEYRNNRITVDFISKDGSTEDTLADTCDGLFRADEQDSCAEEAYDNAFEEAVGGGFGALRLTTEYEDEEDDENDNQRIRIEPIYDADSSVFFDLDAKRQDKADAKYCFVVSSMTPDYYEEMYDEIPTSVDKDIDFAEYDWYSPELVYIAEYYRIEEHPETIYVYQTIDGSEERHAESEFEDDPDLERRIQGTGAQLIREKKVKRKRVHKYLLSGSKILEDMGIIAGKHIPIIPVYGKRWFVDGIERCMGHVRLTKDAQRLKNMLTSKLAEISSLSSVSKPILTPEQIGGHEYMWAEDNVEDWPYLLVNPVTDAAGNSVPSGPVAYTKSPEIPPALAALMQQVDIDMKELLGGSGNTEKMLSHVSGKAHELIQKQIDGQAFIYMSNFAKSIKRTGEVWLSMAKEVYVETGRKMKTIDSMDQMASIELDAPAMINGAPGRANDLTKASFDVAVDVGPSSASQREATVQTLIGMMQITQDQATSQILQSMALMNMEGDGIVEAREYFRKNLVSAGVYPPTEEDKQRMEEEAKNAQPDPQERALIGMANEAEAKAVKTQAEVAKVQSEIELNQAKTAETYSEVNIGQRNAVVESLEREEQIKQAQLQRAQAASQQLQQMGQLAQQGMAPT